MSNDDLLERLEAEAKVADAEPEELTVAVESDIEQKAQEVAELQEAKVEAEQQVEELQDELEEKTTQLEELSDEVEEVASFYAEELAQDSSVMDEDDFRTRFDVAELREKFEALEEEREQEAEEELEEAEETESKPSPDSADLGPDVQAPEGETEGEEAEEELSEAEQVAAEQFEKRGGAWADIADDIRQIGE